MQLSVRNQSVDPIGVRGSIFSFAREGLDEVEALRSRVSDDMLLP